MKSISLPAFKILLMCGMLAGPQSTVAQEARQVTKADLELRKKTPTTRPGSIATVRDGSAVALFADRLEFFAVPPGLVFDPGIGQLKNTKGIVRPLDIEPQKIMWFDFDHGVLIAGNSILVCTNPAGPRLRTGGVEDFCGIVSLAGKIIFKFPFKQRSPDKLLQIVSLNGDGTYAEVYVGRLEGEEDGPEVGEPREILAWRYPNKFSKFPGPWSGGAPKDNDIADRLLQGFRIREKKH